MPFELTLVTMLRVLVEVAGFTMIGQAVLYLFAGRNRQNNFVYRLFQIVTYPVYKAVRAITPRFIIDRHIPWIAFGLIFWIWIGLGVAKRYICLTNNLAC
ncbi:MAG: hypothetical protein HYU77_10675 [Betaproteobacteria bacterium]|nr:hypothetical protein [Betaproteobacteria bacterium]